MFKKKQDNVNEPVLQWFKKGRMFFISLPIEPKMGLILVMCLIALCGTANAIIIGPFPNFKGWEDVTSSIVLDDWIGIDISIPWDGSIKIGRPSHHEFEITVWVPIFAASYIEITSTEEKPFNLQTDNLTVTDIWALDLEPELHPELVPLVTGWDPVSPEIVPLGPGEFIGISGTVYTAGLNVSTLAELGTLLPEYDISIFGGDPDLLVYVSQAVIPAADFAVPEPATLALLGLGGLALRRRRRV